MYKVLIVDDEAIVRMGLKMLIDWEKRGYELIGEAANGRVALEIMEKKIPDIVLTDIKMPEMDGIELIKEISRLYPKVKCVVLSNYNELDIVKKAMKYGAVDYFMKISVDGENLIEILKQVSLMTCKNNLLNSGSIDLESKIDENEDSIKIKFYNYIANVETSNETILKKIFTYNLRINPDEGTLLIIKLNDCNEILKSKFSMDIGLMSLTTMNLIDGIVNNKYSGEVLPFAPGQYLLITDNIPQNSSKDKMLAFQIQAALRSFLEIEALVLYGIQYVSLKNLRANICELDKYNSAFFYEQNTSLIKFNINMTSHGDFYEWYVKAKKEILRYIALYDIPKIKDILEAFFKDAIVFHPEPFVLKEYFKLLINFIKDETLKCLKENDLKEEYENIIRLETLKNLQNIDSFMQLHNLCREIISNLNKYIIPLNNKKVKLVILKLTNYIQVNYCEKLSLKELSKIINMNSSYLCRLFKSETGIHLQSYITKIRMEKAVELLKTKQFTTTQVASMVGYNEVQYFSKVFKSQFALCPSKYLEITSNLPTNETQK